MGRAGTGTILKEPGTERMWVGHDTVLDEHNTEVVRAQDKAQQILSCLLLHKLYTKLFVVTQSFFPRKLGWREPARARHGMACHVTIKKNGTTRLSKRAGTAWLKNVMIK